MKRIALTCAALGLLIACAREQAPPAPPPNVVLVVAHGFGVGAWSLARLSASAAQEPLPLALDSADSFGFLATGDDGALVFAAERAVDAWSRGEEAQRSEDTRAARAPAPPLAESLADASRTFGLVRATRPVRKTSGRSSFGPGSRSGCSAGAGGTSCRRLPRA